MTIFAKPIVNTKLNLKRNKYNEGRGINSSTLYFLLRSPDTGGLYNAYYVRSSGVVDSVGTYVIYGSYGK